MHGRSASKNLKAWTLLTLPLVLVVALWSCPGSAADVPDLAVVRVNGMMVDDVTPILYAQKAGLFRKEGLDVQFSRATSGAAVVPAVTSGTFDIGKSSVVSAINAHLRGIPVVAIAPGWVYDKSVPSAELVVAPDSALWSGKDLNGKTIAVASLNELNQVAASAWVDSHGGDSRTLHFIELPVASSAAALQAHRIDASVLLEPALGAALASGSVKSLGSAYAAIAPHFQVSVWFASRDWSAQHPDLVRKFVRALSLSSAYCNAHHDETAPLIAEATGIPTAVVAHMVRLTLGTRIGASDLQPVIDIAARYHAIPQAFPAADMLFDQPQKH